MRYKKKYLGDVKKLKDERPNKISKSKRSYITRQLRNGRLNSPEAALERVPKKGLQFQKENQDKLCQQGQQGRKICMGQKVQKLYIRKLASIDGDNNLLPHQIEHHVYGDGRGVMFWSCINAKFPGYDSAVYDDILETSLLDTLNNLGFDVKGVRFQQDRATPNTSVITK
ncbi:hypothetical protein INT46_005791 [Mucor plumbeus]|uniref:Uncharacterized protein n=1 Tax=Mucor plumbeus TaxID=97098 RepID=A0A8H7QXB9_9FUNG|nr:hypothetical protein INT46_005791 [Mucor plumbeus]